MPVSRQGEDIVLRLYLQPKASQDKIIGIHGDELKVAITAPPVDGKANAHLLKFLSKLFKVPKSRIQLQKGQLSRHKQLLIQQPEQLPDLIEKLLSNEHL